MQVLAPVAGTVAAIQVRSGDVVAPSDIVVVLEVMKMEVGVPAGVAGRVGSMTVGVGDAIAEGAELCTITESKERPKIRSPRATADAVDGSLLDEVMERHRLVTDEARPTPTAKRHETGRLTAREYVTRLCSDFVEYGPLVIAAQRSRSDIDDLIKRSPADGMIGGIGRIDTGTGGDDRALVVSYDFTVFAGTQGMMNHYKKDRLFALAAEAELPVVLFAEGGGGRPGDVDHPGASQLHVPAFRLFAEITTPTVGVNTGYCFAGNAALLGQCDVVIGTEDSNLGMGGPAMIEGGGLGVFPPTAIGPAAVQAANGVLDMTVADDRAAVEAARILLGLSRGAARRFDVPDQTTLREAIPTNRRAVFDMRSVIAALVDETSFVELRANHAPAVITGLARVDGYPIGIIANDPAHLAGAIDAAAASSMSRHLELCDKWGHPVVFLCDTPGFMVGPDAEAEGLVRAAGRLFNTGASITVPTGTVAVRRGYGLGAMAMAAGGFHAGRFTVGWPTSEFGPMGFEGAARLGFRRELEAIDDPAERDAALQQMVDKMYETGRGLNVATHFEIDDVIDPAETRRWISTLLLPEPAP